MPVVSQSMTRPIVPVGAITVTWALRIAVLLAERERAVGVVARGGQQRRPQCAGVDGTGGTVRPSYSLGGRRVGGAAVVADDAQHRVAVALVARERPELARHLGARGERRAVHDRRQRAAQRDRLGRVVRHAAAHEQRAEVGVAQAERAVVRSCARAISRDGNCAMSTEISSTSVQSRDGVAVRLDVERRPAVSNRSRFSDARLQAVSSRNMYSEHGFEALISPSAGQVCHSLVVSWNCTPGSAQVQAA